MKGSSMWSNCCIANGDVYVVCALNNRSEIQMEVLEMKMERWMYNENKLDRIKNKYVSDSL